MIIMAKSFVVIRRWRDFTGGKGVEAEHVPVKEEVGRALTQEEGACARKRDCARITVAESSKLCPKKGPRQDYGSRMFKAVPEKGIAPELR
jgi:hypothetical protein